MIDIGNDTAEGTVEQQPNDAPNDEPTTVTVQRTFALVEPEATIEVHSDVLLPDP